MTDYLRVMLVLALHMLHNLLTDYDLGRVFIIQSNIQTNLFLFFCCFFSSQFYFAKYHGRLPDIIEKNVFGSESTNSK